jgi:hypothetical protein
VAAHRDCAPDLGGRPYIDTSCDFWNAAAGRSDSNLLKLNTIFPYVSLRMDHNNACRHTYRSRSIGNVVYYYRIRSNPRMVPYRDRPQYFSARTNVYMTTDFRDTTVVGTNGDLLEQQTIWPDSCVRMDDDAIRMRQQQTAAQFAIEGDVGASHYSPTSMSQDCARSG